MANPCRGNNEYEHICQKLTCLYHVINCVTVYIVCDRKYMCEFRASTQAKKLHINFNTNNLQAEGWVVEPQSQPFASKASGPKKLNLKNHTLALIIMLYNAKITLYEKSGVKNHL